MYKCRNCNCEFEEARVINTTYERYYGLENNHCTYLRLELCPNCGTDDFEEYEEIEVYE